MAYGLTTFTPSIQADTSVDEKEEISEATKEDSDSEKKSGKKDKKKEYETIEEFLEDGEYIAIDGFMNIIHETEKDKYFLVLEDNQLNKEFIYFPYILNGPQDVGASGGSMEMDPFLNLENLKMI